MPVAALIQYPQSDRYRISLALISTVSFYSELNQQAPFPLFPSTIRTQSFRNSQVSALHLSTKALVLQTSLYKPPNSSSLLSSALSTIQQDI